MNQIPLALRLPLSMLLLACFARLAHAQEAPPADTTTSEVELLNVDFLEQYLEEGERIRRLAGNVILRQDTTLLRANRVFQYLDRNEILFLGDVLIVDQTDSLTADTVRYDKSTKVGFARGNVRLADGEVEVLAPSGRYAVEQKWATFEQGVTLIDSSAVLRSRAGEYWSEEKRAEFYHDVTLEETGTHLEADSVTFFRETDVSIARGQVFIERFGDDEEAAVPDSSLRTLLFSDWAYNDSQAGYSRIEGNPLLVQLSTDSTGTDTLLVRAARLEASRIDSLRRLVAVTNVELWRSDLAAVADSAVYDRIVLPADTAATDAAADTTRDDLRLYFHPMAWFEQTQVSGDTLYVKARGGAVDSLLVRSQAFVAQLDTLLDRVQQLRGRHLTGTFRNDSLRTLTVGPNAEVIRFLSNQDDELDGAVQVSSDAVTLHFEGGSIRRAAWTSGVEGTQYAVDLIPDPFQLQGYQWVPDRRPTREDLLAQDRVRRRLARPDLPDLAGPAPDALPPSLANQSDSVP